MGKLRKVIYVVLSIVVLLVAACSLLSILRNTESRFLKILDFPRIQFFITSFIALFLFIIFTKRWRWYDYLLTIGLVSGMVVQGSYLINYTFLVPKAVPTATEGTYSTDDQISILIANVQMSSKNAAPLLNLIKANKPDLIITMEIDDWWAKQLEAIEKDYPYTQETTNEVAYGMTLYSKFILESVK
ncbi:endonuclease/exonuclease/phosphatase family protein, partial [Fulvivirga sp. RKSG066]|uniref:endonuclease/exonuclease/phosphatase family protein n=1 Tax=Fulvivirga aurantia TaxID=2529383 RepID=UPI0016265A68